MLDLSTLLGSLFGGGSGGFDFFAIVVAIIQAILAALGLGGTS